MKQYIYYWYHHMMPVEERERIEKILQEKDYFAFIDVYKEYSIKAIEYGQYDEELHTWIPVIFLPENIIVWDNEEIVDSLNVLDKENFEKITYAECECG